MSKPIQNLVTTAVDSIFEPTPSQRKCKAALLIALESNPSFSLESLTLAKATQLTGMTSLKRWWAVPGFQEWIRNKEEFRSGLEYLCNLGLEVAEDLLLDTNPKTASARVSLMKIILEAAGKLTRVKEVKLLDEAVNKMNKTQLEEYLKRVGKIKAINNG